jgi:hypothetical protein
MNLLRPGLVIGGWMAAGYALLRAILGLDLKIAYTIGCALTLLVLGCTHETRCAQPQPPAGAKALSDGNFTWVVGAVSVNGTNIPMDNIKVQALTNQVSK